MDEALRVVYEMNQSVWSRLHSALEGLEDAEIDWRPLPEANTINLIVRHLRIESAWHVDSLERGEPMPTIAIAARQQEIDAAAFDFTENFQQLTEFYRRFLQLLRTVTLDMLQQRSAMAYSDATGIRGQRHLLAYHQAMHVATHCGQIRTIRNLYRKTRGEPARFFPENPTYPPQLH